VARPAFAGRRARSRFGQLAAFGGIVLLTSAALSVLGSAIVPVLDSGARTIVTQSGPTGSALRVETRLGSDPDEQDATVRAAFTTALRDVPATVLRTVTVDTQAVIDGAAIPVQVLADPGITDVAQLQAGEWPAGPGETAIQDAAAAALSLAVGDTLTVGDRTLTVTGTWRADDPAAPRWFGDPAVGSSNEEGFIGPFLVDEPDLLDFPDTPRVRWTLSPHAAAIGVTALPDTAEAIARLRTEVRRMGGGDTSVQLLGTLDQTVSHATRVTAVAAGVLGLPLVLVAVAGAIVLSLVARAIASGRAGEFLLLRARGASARAVTGSATREAAVTAVIGAAIGAGLAIPALRFGLPLVGASGEAPVLLAVAIAAGVAALAIIVTAIATAAQLSAPVTGRAEAGRAATIASLGPLALSVVVTALALAQFLSLGSPVVVRSDGVVRTDPVALAAPVLVLLTGALAAPAIAGPLVAIAERFARGARGILPVLPLRQLARRTRSVAAGVLVMALAAGAVVVALAFTAAASDVRVQAERAATGADLRLILPVRSSVESTAPAASTSILDGVEGIDGAFAVLATTANAGSDAIPLLAGDAGRLGSLPGGAELAGFADPLISARGGVPIPAGMTRLTVSAHLLPGAGLPAGLSVDLLLWLADEDGSALRVPFGSTPLAAGAATVTGDIPADATTVLAVEFRPPALPFGTTVDVVLDGVATPDGGTLAFTGSSGIQLTSSVNQRFVPQASSSDPLPIVLGADLAERFALTVGAEFSFRVGSIPSPLSATVVGIVDAAPGVRGSSVLILDLQTLESRAVDLDGSVPAANQVWVTTDDPDATAAALRATLTRRADIVTPRTESPSPVLDPTVALIALGVGVTALLAIMGFAAVAASIAHRRRIELTPLRSLGLSPTRIRASRVIELAATAAIAIVLGAAAGVLTAYLVVPGLVGVLG
jgi:hypothetical protein